MIPKIELRRYAKTADQTWSDSYSTFTITNLSASESIETNKDGFRLTMNNPNSVMSSFFGYDDRIQIYAYTGASATANDLLFDGLISEVRWELESGGRRMSVIGFNLTQELLGSLVSVREMSESFNASDIIEQVLNTVNNNNAATVGDERYIEFDNSSVAQTKEDSSAFPNKTFVMTYKPAYDVIRQFSDDEYTEDGQYIFYFDKNNKFYWRKKTALTYDGLDLDEGVNIESLSIERGKFDVFNSLIVNTGKDAYGNGNHVLQINTVSILELGAKWKYLDRSTISERIFDAERTANPASFNTDAQGNFTDDLFPISYNYDMEFQWDSDGDGIPDTNTVTSDAEFNQAIRQEAKRKGREEAISFLTLHGDAIYRGSIQINGSLSYTLGKVVKVTSASVGLTDKNLRIDDISHSFSKRGWKTTINVQEDQEDA